jgi:uncharacterized membrane protein YsdA (DUF1294 family)/cold shock CspA family protein
MRFQGRIAEWRDDQGYGFIAQNGDGRRVFVHIKSFVRRGRRPAANDVVTYRIGVENGRECAQQVAYASSVASRASGASMPSSSAIWVWLAWLYLILIVVAVAMRSVPWTILGYAIVINGMTYLSYTLDKQAARQEQRRTPEVRLHLFALIGGWPAALLAQKRLRHKTVKAAFQFVFKTTILLHLTAVAWLFSTYGAAARQLLQIKGLGQ